MGLSFSDIFDDDISYEQKPPEMFTPMEETDFPIQAKDLFGGLWETDLLSEVHLQDLYHATNCRSFLEILKTEAIKLAFVGGTQADQFHNKDHPFFLSTMRQKYGNYARDIGAESGFIKNDTVIHLDGRAITAAGFKVFPVDYWGHGSEHSEQEERIAGDKDELKPLSKFIKDVHILVTKDLKHPFTIEQLYAISDLAPQQNFPIYFYPESEVNYFKMQRPEGKSVKDVRQILDAPVWSAEDLELKNHLQTRKPKQASYLEAFMRIYNKDYSKIRDFPDKNVIRWLHYYEHDAYAQLFADIHNYKTNHLPIFRDVVAAMKKEGVKSFRDLITLVIEREHERLNQERDLQEAEELGESEELHFDVDYDYQNRQAFCVFIIYPQFSVWFKRKDGKATFFSDNPKLQEKLNLFNDTKRSTHNAIRSALQSISNEPGSESILPKHPYSKSDQMVNIEEASGRMWGINGKLYVSFWQERGGVKPHWNKVEKVIRAVGEDPKNGLYLFGGSTTEDALNTYEEVTKGFNFKPSDPEAELRKKLHTNPDLKKAILSLPPDRIQSYADKMGIPVAQLKALSMIDEVQDAIPPEYGVNRSKSVTFNEANSIFIIYGGLVTAMQELSNKMVFFSNEPRVERSLNTPANQKFFSYGEKRDLQLTHTHLAKLVKGIVQRTKYPVVYDTDRYGDVAGRVWKFHDKNSKVAVVGFWQTIEAVRSKWHQVQVALEKLDVDWKVAEYTFTDIINQKFSYMDIIGKQENPEFSEIELEIKKKLHTSPQLKKAILNLPPDKIQAYADKMNIPVIKLKQLAGSGD